MTDRVIHRVPLDDLHLETQQFNSKDDIKPWLQGALRHNKGIDIVIERSDTTKIIFRCKNNVNEKRIVKSKEVILKSPYESTQHVHLKFEPTTVSEIRYGHYCWSVMNTTTPLINYH